MNRLRLFACSAVAALAAVGAAHGDLLVTKEGATIETAGPWKVQGRQIVFTLPDGTLSSMRTDAVDLDRSALATAHAADAAARAENPPAAAPAEPVMRLTEADFTPPPPPADASAAAKPADAQQANQPLTVASWDKVEMPSGDGIQIFGTVKNATTNHITSPTMMVTVYGEGGGMLATADAAISSGSIAPGGSANFHAEFPGLPDFVSVKFSTSARGFETRPAEGEETYQEVGDDTGAADDTASVDDVDASDVPPASDAPSNDEPEPAPASDADAGPPPAI